MKKAEIQQNIMSQVILYMAGVLATISLGVSGFFATNQTVLAQRISEIDAHQSGTAATVVEMSSQLLEIKQAQIQTNKKLDCIISPNTCLR